MRVIEWLRKLDVPRGKLRGQCIRIRNIKVGIPPCRWLSLVVWERTYANTLKQDHRSTAAHNTEERIISGLLKCDIKAEPIAIERKRCRGILHDEEWRDAANFWLSHM